MGQRVEMLTWRTSSFSGANGGACVEVAGLPTGRAVRDSKNPAHAVLWFTSGAWSAFVEGVRTGQFV